MPTNASESNLSVIPVSDCTDRINVSAVCYDVAIGHLVGVDPEFSCVIPDVCFTQSNRTTSVTNRWGHPHIRTRIVGPTKAGTFFLGVGLGFPDGVNDHRIIGGVGRILDVQFSKKIQVILIDVISVISSDVLRVLCGQSEGITFKLIQKLITRLIDIGDSIREHHIIVSDGVASLNVTRGQQKSDYTSGLVVNRRKDVTDAVQATIKLIELDEHRIDGVVIFQVNTDVTGVSCSVVTTDVGTTQQGVVKLEPNQGVWSVGVVQNVGTCCNLSRCQISVDGTDIVRLKTHLVVSTLVDNSNTQGVTPSARVTCNEVCVRFTLSKGVLKEIVVVLDIGASAIIRQDVRGVPHCLNTEHVGTEDFLCVASGVVNTDDVANATVLKEVTYCPPVLIVLISRHTEDLLQFCLSINFIELVYGTLLERTTQTAHIRSDRVTSTPGKINLINDNTRRGGLDNHCLLPNIGIFKSI